MFPLCVCVCMCISVCANGSMDESAKLTITDMLALLKTGSLSGQSIDLSLTLDLTDAAHTTAQIMTPWKSPSLYPINPCKWMIGLNGALMMSECRVVMGGKEGCVCVCASVCVCISIRVNELKICLCLWKTVGTKDMTGLQHIRSWSP